MKEILLTSIVAATLIFSGCGGSSSSSKDSKKEDPKKEKPKGESTLNNMGFTDINKSKVTWSEADKICKDNNLTLPPVSWFEDNNSNVVLNSINFEYVDVNGSNEIKDGEKFNSALWTSTENNNSLHQYWGYANDKATDGTPDDQNATYFFTCIKPAQ